MPKYDFNKVAKQLTNLMGLYSRECVCRGLIFGMLIGLHIWGAYIRERGQGAY